MLPASSSFVPSSRKSSRPISLPPRMKNTSTHASPLARANAITSWSFMAASTTRCRSVTFSTARIWSRTTAARSNCIASAASSMRCRSMPMTSSCFPSRNITTCCITAMYSSCDAAPMHGPRQRCMWNCRHGRGRSPVIWMWHVRYGNSLLSRSSVLQTERESVNGPK
jgi:hypothetical protein